MYTELKTACATCMYVAKCSLFHALSGWGRANKKKGRARETMREDLVLPCFISRLPPTESLEQAV